MEFTDKLDEVNVFCPVSVGVNEGDAGPVVCNKLGPAERSITPETEDCRLEA